MNKTTNYQDLLKTLAIITMIIDHVGLFFCPDLEELRIIGRYAMPIFTFFAGYNFKNQINLTIFFAGAVLYAISTIFIFQSFVEANILISIFLGQIYLYLFRKNLTSFNRGYIHFVLLACLWPLTFKLFDYGTLSIAVMVMGHLVKTKIISNSLATFTIAFVNLLNSLFNFEWYHNSTYTFLAIIVTIFLYITMIWNNFTNSISFNLTIISRHTLLIYFIHWLFFQLLWRYYI